MIFLTLFCCSKEEKKLGESIMRSPKTEIDLQFYGENELEKEKNLTDNIENAFATITDNAQRFHNYYICSKRNVQIYVILIRPNRQRIKISNINGCLIQQ